jgi:hypothetical protein
MNYAIPQNSASFGGRGQTLLVLVAFIPEAVVSRVSYMGRF